MIVNTDEPNPHFTATIVSSYVLRHAVRPEQLPDLITTVHHALGNLGQLVQAEEVLTPAVSVRRSVHHDYVVCMDCGYRGQTLRRHISTRHSMSRDAYLKRWGLRSNHPLTAPAYSERRSTLAKALGARSQGHSTGDAGVAIGRTGAGRCRSGLRGEAVTETQNSDRYQSPLMSQARR